MFKLVDTSWIVFFLPSFNKQSSFLIEILVDMPIAGVLARSSALVSGESLSLRLCGRGLGSLEICSAEARVSRRGCSLRVPAVVSVLYQFAR